MAYGQMSVGKLKGLLANWDDDLEVDWYGAVNSGIWDTDSVVVRVPDTGKVLGTLQSGPSPWAKGLIDDYRDRMAAEQQDAG